MNTRSRENDLHLAFQVSLIVKGVFALLEIVGGVAAYFISQQFLLSLILSVTRGELIEDPSDPVVQYLVQTANAFSLSARYFTSIYRKRRPRPIRKDLEGRIATRWRHGLQIR